MKTSIIAGSLLTALTLTVPLQAQQVAADVVLRSGPVAGHVVIGNGYSTYRRPVVYRAPARVIVVERVVPRVVIVERMGRRNHGFARSWRQQGYRQVVVYYRDGRYYDRYVRGWPEMGRRYDAPADGAAVAPTTPVEEQSSLDVWKAIDEGRDPTDASERPDH